MERKWHVLLALAAGVLIGLNWDKVKRVGTPIAKKIGEKSVDCCAGAIKFFAEQKERLEDTRAEVRSKQRMSMAPARVVASKRKTR